VREPHCGDNMQAMHPVLPLHIRAQEQASCAEARIVHQEFQIASGHDTLFHSFPRRANSRANSAPIPLDAPVINASGIIFSVSRW
jgi:hypothetical protein